MGLTDVWPNWQVSRKIDAWGPNWCMMTFLHWKIDARAHTTIGNPYLREVTPLMSKYQITKIGR